MSLETPDLTRLAARLEMIVDRLEKLEVQVRGDRGEIRARLEMQQYAPCLTFYDGAGQERLKIGLRADSSSLIQIERRDIPLGDG